MPSRQGMSPVSVGVCIEICQLDFLTRLNKSFAKFLPVRIRAADADSRLVRRNSLWRFEPHRLLRLCASAFGGNDCITADFPDLVRPILSRPSNDFSSDNRNLKRLMLLNSHVVRTLARIRYSLSESSILQAVEQATVLCESLNSVFGVVVVPGNTVVVKEGEHFCTSLFKTFFIGFRDR